MGDEVAVFATGRGDNRFDISSTASSRWYLSAWERACRPEAVLVQRCADRLIWWGFLVLQVRTINFLLKGFSTDISLEHIGGTFYDVIIRAPMDLFNILVIVGCLMAAYQRRSGSRAHTLNLDGWLILWLIGFLMVSDVFLNSFEFATTRIPGRHGVPRVGSRRSGVHVARRRHARALLDFFWYCHLYDFLLFLNYLRYSRSPTCSPCCSTSSSGASSRRASCNRFATSRRGALRGRPVQDLSWKQMLDPYTCTECGRCEINCPAYPDR